MEDIVPLISSSVVGPLGVTHLPRLWLKILLHASGRLPEGYRHGSGGFDEMTCVDIGLEPADVVEFVETAKPGYLEFEAWVREHATALDPASIAAHNQKLLNWRMREELAAERRARFEIDDPTYAAGIPLNDLDDWDGVHTLLMRARATESVT